MNATEVIEIYIGDTARLLPGSQREDVATELRSLLNEELQVRALESGRPPDESLALSLVRGYGYPNEVAARYQPPWAIIDPADSTNFMRAAIIGAGALVAIHGQWHRLTRRISIGINIAIVCLVLAFAVDGKVFQSTKVDQVARDVLALVAVGYVPVLGLLLYGEIGRVERIATTTKV